MEGNPRQRDRNNENREKLLFKETGNQYQKTKLITRVTEIQKKIRK